MTRVAVAESIDSLEESIDSLEPTPEAPPKSAALESGEMLCFRVRVPEWHCSGLGHFTKGQLGPIDIYNAPIVRATADREDRRHDPVIEILIGRPNPPSASSMSQAPKPTWALRERSEIGHATAPGSVVKSDPLYGFGQLQRNKIKKITAQLLAEKPSSFFSEKSPQELAIEQVIAEENAKIDKERKRHQDALDWCYGQVTKRAERLRREQEELERQAKEAERQAEKLESITAAMPVLSELYTLRDRFQQHLNRMDPMCAPNEANENKIRWGGSAGQYHEIRSLIAEGLKVNRENDAAALREIVDKLDVVSQPRPLFPPTIYNGGGVSIGGPTG